MCFCNPSIRTPYCDSLKCQNELKRRNTKYSIRANNWKIFADKVFEHIESYTVPQYGDKGNDLITKKDSKWCIEQIEKYVKRFGTNQRANQTELDLIKIAHYAQMALEKLKEEEIYSNYLCPICGQDLTPLKEKSNETNKTII